MVFVKTFVSRYSEICSQPNDVKKIISSKDRIYMYMIISVYDKYDVLICGIEEWSPKPLFYIFKNMEAKLLGGVKSIAIF